MRRTFSSVILVLPHWFQQGTPHLPYGEGRIIFSAWSQLWGLTDEHRFKHAVSLCLWFTVPFWRGRLSSKLSLVRNLSASEISDKTSVDFTPGVILLKAIRPQKGNAKTSQTLMLSRRSCWNKNCLADMSYCEEIEAALRRICSMLL